MEYEKINMRIKEKIKCIGIYVGIMGIISFFFYRSCVSIIIFAPGYILFRRMYTQRLIDLRKAQLLDEFSECLYSVSINMKSGYSLENAFLDSQKDMVLFYGEKSLMVKELERMRKGLDINQPLEDILEDLARRSHEKEIIMFSDVCKSAKRNGGNITEVLSNTADRIRSGICTDKEIDTILSEKKLELGIMEAVPFLLMAYLEVTSAGYFNSLYEGIQGRVFMTGCLAIYVAAVFIGKKILNIEV